MILVLLILLLIGKGFSNETGSGRYVMIKSTSFLRLEMCALNDNIETCGTWPHPSSYNCTSHFSVYSVNKDSGLQGKYTSHVHQYLWTSVYGCVYVVSSNIQSFYQTWNQYKCNCCPESPATGIRTFALIAMTLVGIFLLLFIVVTIGWIWTCRIAIERGKLIKNKGEIMILSNQNYLVTALFMHISHICREYHSFVSKQGLQCPLNTSWRSGIPGNLLWYYVSFEALNITISKLINHYFSLLFW